MKFKVVLRDLKNPRDGPQIEIGNNLSKTEAERLQKRFAKLDWEERRPGIMTIDTIALIVEIDHS